MMKLLTFVLLLHIVIWHIFDDNETVLVRCFFGDMYLFDG